MPYKDRKKRLAYMRAYHKRNAEQIADLEKAIEAGNLAEAKKIIGRKPTVSLATIAATG